MPSIYRFNNSYLELKVGTPIMLLRNLDAPRLCNGTRLSVKSLMPHVIEATILIGCANGEDVFIPPIPIIPTDMPFEFKRLEFPIRLAFVMSINKAQGQSLKVAGINLETPTFSHGQLYVTSSRFVRLCNLMQKLKTLFINRL
jgi:ATP-dependent DNA helicase PIF1